jgi:hypothetical protein
MKRIACLVGLALASLSAGEVQLMQNLDGDLSFTGASPRESKEKLQQLVDEIAAGPAKTLMWSIGAGSDILYYPTQVASTWGWRHTKYSDDPKWKTRIERCRAATDAGLDAPRIVGERARERGLRFFPSYRMNDAHYTSDPLHYPLTGRFWMEHQDATIGRSPVAGYEGYKHLLNFARDEVRAYRLAVIFEAMDRYADLMDGIELDFNRFQIFFPPGTASQNAHHITAMLEKVRERLNAIGDEQHRPLQLVVRVPPAMPNCTWAGLDVATWMKRRLIDVIIPAQVMTLSHDMPIDEFVRLGKPEGIEVIGSIYGRAGYNWPFSAEHTREAYAAEVSRTPSAAQFLGAALNQRYLGASGHQIYNYILHTDEAAVTALSTLKGDRRYLVTQGYFHDREDTYEYRKQLPAVLKPGAKIALRLLIGQNVSQAAAYLRLGLYGANKAYDDVALAVQINGQPLHEGSAAKQLVVTTGTRHGNGSHPPPTEAYVQWPLTGAVLLREGWNTIDVTLTSSTKLLQLTETEIAITHP